MNIKLKEEFKEFFKFSNKKLIIPLILVIFLFSVFTSTIILNNQVNNYSCQIYNLNAKLESATTLGNQEQINNAKADIEVLQDEVNSVIEDKKPTLIYAFVTNRYLTTYFPFYPVDCGLAADNKLCNYYFSEESYQCVKGILNSSENSLASLVSEKIPEYKKFSYLQFTISIIAFIIIGYLLSCIISLIYKKSKKLKSKIRLKNQ